MAISIKNWNTLFEVAQSKKVKGELHWVAVPTKHDGKSFRRIMRADRGIEVYAAWILILQVAAKCPVRGILSDDCGPLTTEDLELKTGCQRETFEYAIKLLCSKEIGWLEELQDTTAVVSATTTDYDATPTRHNRTVQDKTILAARRKYRRRRRCPKVSLPCWSSPATEPRTPGGLPRRSLTSGGRCFRLWICLPSAARLLPGCLRLPTDARQPAGCRNFWSVGSDVHRTRTDDATDRAGPRVCHRGGRFRLPRRRLPRIASIVPRSSSTAGDGRRNPTRRLRAIWWRLDLTPGRRMPPRQ